MSPTDYGVDEDSEGVGASSVTIRDRTVYLAAWRITHREHIKAQGLIYRSARREKEKARAAAWVKAYRAKKKATDVAYRAAHREEIKEYQRGYHATHRPEAKARNQAWAATHPNLCREICRVGAALRRARKKGLTATLSRSQWQAILVAYKHRCAYCGVFFPQLTQDHVIPIIKGGGTTPDNIVPACRSCNSKKHTGPPVVIPAIRLMI